MSFSVLFVVSIGGVVASTVSLLKSLYKRFSSHRGGEVIKPTPAQSHEWWRCYAHILLFLANEFIFEALLLSGAATAWRLPNAFGRIRMVYPLRYITWASTNSYIVMSTAYAMRMGEKETLFAVASIVVTTLSAFPLELREMHTVTWGLSAIAATASLFTCGSLIARRIFALLPVSSPIEFVAFSTLSFATATSYLAFPFIFFFARYCGGDGKDTCLSNADEAFVWRVTESFAKFVFLGVVIIANIVGSRAHDALAAKTGVRNPVRVLDLPMQYKTATHSSAWDAISNSLPSILGFPAALGANVYVMQDTLISIVLQSAGSAGDAAQAALTVQRGGGVLVVIATASAFFVTLDLVLRLERNRALIQTLLPADYFADDAWFASAGVFDAANVLYVEEPHVTLLFCDVVGSTPNTLAVTPIDVMGTLAALFRHFDQLHAAAGVAKVETVGDEYMSVIGAVAPGMRHSLKGLGAPAPHTVISPTEQAITMATLAIALVRAARDHVWPNGTPVEVRVGLHCGPASTGVLGGTLPRWTVYGATVVIASRMESSGERGKVHATSEFVGILRAAGAAAAPFAMLGRGSIKVKGVGLVKTFWLEIANEKSRAAEAAEKSRDAENTVRAASKVRAKSTVKQIAHAAPRVTYRYPTQAL